MYYFFWQSEGRPFHANGFAVHWRSNFQCWLLTSAASPLLQAWLSPWIQPRRANCYHSGAVGRREHQLLCDVDKEIEAFINLTPQESDNNYNDNVFAGENEVGSDKSSDKWWYTSEKTGFTPLRWSNILHVNIYLLRRVFCLSWPNQHGHQRFISSFNWWYM